MARTILVAGATGALGRQLLIQAVGRTSAQTNVIALVRDRQKLGSLASLVGEVREVHALEKEALKGKLDGVDTVISCAGASVMPSLRGLGQSYSKVDRPINIALADEAKRAGVKRFVYVSVMGANEHRHLAYNRAHEAVVDHLAAIGLDHVTMRPTGFFSALEEYLRMAQRGVVPLIGDGSAQSNPIADEDLATACLDASDGPPGPRELGGPDILSRKEMAEMAFQALGKKPRFVRLPVWFFRLAGGFSGLVSSRLRELFPFLTFVSTTTVTAPALGRSHLLDHFHARVAAQKASATS